MIKVFKYLKSSIFSVLAVILLLIVQAILDLTLPDYTSKIINVGVQQGGIENAAIEQIGEGSLEKVLLFTSSKNKKYILSNYTVSNKTYKGEKIYKLKTDSNKDKISNILSKPMTIISYIEQSKNSKNTTINFDIPNNMDIYQALSYMSSTEKEKMLAGINKKMKNIPDTIIDQAGVSYVKSEYKRIGINTTKIQNAYIFKTGMIMVGIALAVMIDGILVVLIGSRMAAKLAKTLRRKTFKKVVGFSKSEIKEYGQSSLITRTTNDVQQVQMVIVFLLRVVFYAPIIDRKSVV